MYLVLMYFSSGPLPKNTLDVFIKNASNLNMNIVNKKFLPVICLEFFLN